MKQKALLNYYNPRYHGARQSFGNWRILLIPWSCIFPRVLTSLKKLYFQMHLVDSIRIRRCEILAKIFWSDKLLIMKCSRVSYELHWWGNGISWRNWYNLRLVLTIFNFAFLPSPWRCAQTRKCLFVVVKQTRTTIETSGHEATLKRNCEIHKVNYCQDIRPKLYDACIYLTALVLHTENYKVYQGLNLFQPDGSGRKLFSKFRYLHALYFCAL